MIEKRDAVNVIDRQEADKSIKKNLFKEDYFNKSKNIFIYIGFGSEINTSIYIKEFLEMGKNIYVPRVKKGSRIMEAIKIDNLEDLTENKYGILEPSDEKKAVSGEILDLIILPGVAFDEKGSRLGYGGGFYDIFLQNNAKDVIKVALAYEFQILDSIPLEDHDIKANYLITDKKSIKCS